MSTSRPSQSNTTPSGRDVNRPRQGASSGAASRSRAQPSFRAAHHAAARPRRAPRRADPLRCGAPAGSGRPRPPPGRPGSPSSSMIRVPSRSGRSAAELLCLGELVDPPLQLLVGLAQPGGLPLVAGGAVGTGEDVQPLQLVTGIADVAAHGRIRPLALAVAVEPQVQLDQRSRPPSPPRWRSAAPAAACGPASPRPRRGGGRRPCRRARTCGSAACRCRAAALPSRLTMSGAWPRARSSSIACSTTVRVCSYTSLWRLCSSRSMRSAGSSGSTMSASPVFDQQVEAWTRVVGQQQLHQLVTDPLCRDDLDPCRPSAVIAVTTSSSGWKPS